MNDKIPREIIDILKAIPKEEEEISDLPFKMPENPHLWADHEILIRDFKIKDNKRL